MWDAVKAVIGNVLFYVLTKEERYKIEWSNKEKEGIMKRKGDFHKLQYNY